MRRSTTQKRIRKVFSRRLGSVIVGCLGLVHWGCDGGSLDESATPVGVKGAGGDVAATSGATGRAGGPGGFSLGTLGAAATGGASGSSVPLGTGNQGPDQGQTQPGTSPSCGSVKVDATVEINETVVEVPGNVLFVFDQSQSMGESWEGKPKWQAANDAVVGAFTPLQDKLNAGVVLFPAATTTTPDKTCDFLKDPFGCLAGSSSGGLCPEVAPIASSPQLPIQTGKAYLQAWNTYWTKGAKALAQGTPTEKALLEAEKALASPPPGNTAVVLVTDGQPTCGSNESAIAARLRQKNIKTYVVGLPGSAGTRVLDQVAIAGDTAPAGCTSKCFLSPADPTELQSALASIATKTVSTTTVKRLESCSFQLAAPKDADPSNVHMVATKAADGQQYEVPRDGNGWTLSADNRTATLGDDLCNKAKAGAFTGLSFQYGCVAVPIIIL